MALRLGAGALLLGCNPATTRPYFGPVTGAMQIELALQVPAATRVLADALTADSLPLRRVEPIDGFLETDWLGSATRQPTQERRLGLETVRIRAWVGPTRPLHSQLVVETVYRPLADPSLPDRELERQVPPDHPVAQRVQAVLQKLGTQYGDSLRPASPSTSPTKP